jgi:hypothetical protein
MAWPVLEIGRETPLPTVTREGVECGEREESIPALLTM